MFGIKYAARLDPITSTKKSTGTYKTKKSAPKFKGRLGRAVSRLLKGVEMKYVEKLSTDSISETMTCTCLSLVAQGDDDKAERIGGRINANQIHIKCALQGDNNASSNLRMFARVMLIEDKEDYQNSGVPINTDILENTGTSTAMLVSHRKWVAARFHVLYDKVFSLQELGSGNSQRYFEISRKLGREITYSGEDATTASICKNHLWLVVFVDSPVSAIASGHEATLAYASRLYYTDN